MLGPCLISLLNHRGYGCLRTDTVGSNKLMDAFQIQPQDLNIRTCGEGTEIKTEKIFTHPTFVKSKDTVGL